MSTFTVGCSPSTTTRSPLSLSRIYAFPPPPSSPIAVCFRPLYTRAKPLCLHKTGVGSLSTSQSPNRKQWIVKAAAEEEGEEVEKIGEEEVEEIGEELEDEEIEEELEDEAEEDKKPKLNRKKLKLLLKTPKKQRLVLKFIWMEKNIGLGLDQFIPGHGTIPLTPYYFWPRKDAWEELKAALESKPWISQKRSIILLNQATDIINLWQQSGSNI